MVLEVTRNAIKAAQNRFVSDAVANGHKEDLAWYTAGLLDIAAAELSSDFSDKYDEGLQNIIFKLLDAKYFVADELKRFLSQRSTFELVTTIFLNR